MARRTPGPASAPDADATAVHRLNTRWMWLRLYGWASDPLWPWAEKIRDEHDRLTHSGLPVEERLQRLDRWLDERGLLEGATRFADNHGDHRHKGGPRLSDARRSPPAARVDERDQHSPIKEQETKP